MRRFCERSAEDGARDPAFGKTSRQLRNIFGDDVGELMGVIHARLSNERDSA